MNNKEINQQIANRYLKWSKISLRIGLISLIITIILIALNTGDPTLQLLCTIGMVLSISCISEYCILQVLCHFMSNKK